MARARHRVAIGARSYKIDALMEDILDWGGMFDWFWRHLHKPPAAVCDLQVKITEFENRRKHHMSTATLTWTPPIIRTDGSPLAATDIASASVFDSLSPTPATPIGTVVGALGTFTTGPLSAGVHIFTVTTTDTNGDVSAPSNAASGTVALAAPAAITNLAVVVSS
jgi:hypothetical protein